MIHKTSTINARINERTLFPYFVNDRGCMHKKIMHLKEMIIQIFLEGGKI